LVSDLFGQFTMGHQLRNTEFNNAWVRGVSGRGELAHNDSIPFLPLAGVFRPEHIRTLTVCASARVSKNHCKMLC